MNCYHRILNLSMRQELEFDLNDKSSADLSPNTVLLSPQYSLNVKKIYKKGKAIGKDEFLKLKEDFAQIKFAQLHNSSYNKFPCRSHGLESNVGGRGGSILKKMDTMEGRKKIEISCRSSDASFSGSIVDSLCSSDDEPSEISQNSNVASPSVSASWASMECNSPEIFIDFINPDVWDRNSSAVEGIDSMYSKVRGDNKVACSTINGDSPLPKDTFEALHKYHSAMVEVADFPSPLQSDCSSRGNPKPPFSPVGKRLNSFAKSKSPQSPVSHMLEDTKVKLPGTTTLTRNRTYQKSLLNDFSNAAKHADIVSEFIRRDIKYSGLACSPVHLHGNLRLKIKQGLPTFEFKVKCPEDVFVAKPWRAGNTSNWVYTFHSINSRKKSDASGLKSHDCDKYPSIVAQMLVSCNLCSKLEGGVLDNSMVTEFVLYDLMHSRRSVSCKKKSNTEQDASKMLKACRVGAKGETLMVDEKSLASKNKLPTSNVDFDESNSCPLSSAELHPNLEIASIRLQIPFDKRKSLKYKREDMREANSFSKLSDVSSVVEHCRKSFHNRKMQEQVKVVLPTGIHGLPSGENLGPSSLLDRWKHGGGCDCGGWDMACPLILLGNPSIHFAEDQPLIKDYQPLQLFLQGAKENTPTFSMSRVEEGEYAVDFHARLSPLQAFSVCVTILHGTSTCSLARREKNQPLSQCNSLEMLMREEAELFMQSKEKNKTMSKTHKGITLPYVTMPPFSPVARV
ncbi:uncharacterized protein [Arachis hypogaea]|uniref:uncharacterized protein isoform X1 n=1 Tax=Arachis hypogaea TaxID=3818 RepID=UPI000DEC31D4|nr:uncharacterized protein LOC112801472 isoform X1 [Arachis hypogaea]QHO41985.1 uncharacterized protein DS421_5g150460 [Arachis hypogaea]